MGDMLPCRYNNVKMEKYYYHSSQSFFGKRVYTVLRKCFKGNKVILKLVMDNISPIFYSNFL